MNSFYLKVEIENKIYEYDFEKSMKTEFFFLEAITTKSHIELNIIPNIKIKILKINYNFEFDFLKSDKIFLNGYQSWTNSKEENIDEKEKALKFFPEFLTKKYGLDRYGDFTFSYKEKDKKYGYSYSYIRRNKIFYLFASINEKTGFTIFYVNNYKNGIVFEKDCENREITEKYNAINVIAISGSEESVFNTWFHKLNIFAFDKTHKTGYTSWYNHYQNINENIILNDLEGMKNLPIKADIFQIDDGYQEHIGDWLLINKEKFPNGMKNIADRIKENGYCAGIWLAPFVCEKESNLYKIHPKWILKDEENKPYYVGCNWSGAYALDFYNEEVREYLIKCLDYYTECGYDLFKLDFLYAVCIKPDKDKTRGEIMFEAMDFLKKHLKDKLILGCGVPLASAFNKVNYCRVGCDMTLDYNDKFFMRFTHPERPSTKNTMINTIYRRQLNKRGFMNDPDVFLLRKTNTKLSKKEKKNLAIINGLFGGVLFSSDNFSDYDEDSKEIFKEVCELKNAEIIDIQETKRKIKVEYSVDNIKKQVVIKK